MLEVFTLQANEKRIRSSSPDPGMGLLCILLSDLCIRRLAAENALTLDPRTEGSGPFVMETVPALPSFLI